MARLRFEKLIRRFFLGKNHRHIYTRFFLDYKKFSRKITGNLESLQRFVRYCFNPESHGLVKADFVREFKDVFGDSILSFDIQGWGVIDFRQIDIAGDFDHFEFIRSLTFNSFFDPQQDFSIVSSQIEYRLYKLNDGDYWFISSS